MSSLLSPLERERARADRELARRRGAQLKRFLRLPELSAGQRDEAESQLDECERDGEEFGLLLDGRIGRPLSSLAGPEHTLEAAPYTEQPRHV